MQTANRITIFGNPAELSTRVYQLAADIQNWPTILPHYRYMRILELSERSKLADFGARRGPIPVYWQARQELFPETRRITFEHVRGVTTGMQVEWRIEQREGGVLVTIHHALSYPVPVFGPLFAKYIVGGLFVRPIAGKTLKCFKQLLEADQPERIKQQPLVHRLS